MHGQKHLALHSLTPPHKTMAQFFSLCRAIRDFDLATILRSICLPFVFLFVLYSELIALLTTIQFELPEYKTPKIAVSPLFVINEQLQSLTISNLKELQSSPKRIKKQLLINSYLELASL